MALALLLLANAPGAAERRYYFDSIDSELGLAQHTVNAIFQDHTGYIWIATQGGLHQYDGYRYLLYQHNADDPTSLPDSFVTAIAEDSRGQLWIGGNTRNLASFDPNSGKARAFTLPDGGHNTQRRNAIGALKFDPARGLWLGTAAGIELFDIPSGQRRELFQFPEGSADPRVRRIALGTDGAVWAATTSGLVRIAANGEAGQIVALRTLGAALAILVAHDGSVFAGTTDGVFRVVGAEDRAERIWPTSASQHDSHGAIVRDIVEDRRGRLWLAVYGEGLAIFDPGSGDTEWLRHDREIPGSLPEENETALLTDRSGLLWVGGESRGVSITDPQGALFHYAVDHDPVHTLVNGNNIRAVWEDSHRQLWLGTEGDGLKRYDSERGSFDYYGDVLGQALGLKSQPQELRVFDVLGADQGRIWVGSNRGVFLLEPDKRRATLLPVDAEHGHGLPSASVRTMLQARDGSMWFGTYNSGLAHWWPKTSRWEFFRHRDAQRDSLAHDFVLALFEDRSERIWIGTLDGLSLYDPAHQSLRSFRYDPADARSLSDNLVRAIRQTSDGVLWFGTHSGLNRMDESGDGKIHFTRYLTQDGLPSATIYGILADDDDRLWLSTNRGISLFDRKRERFRAFSLKDGLQGLEFNGGAYCRRADGELVFGGINGINLFRPERVEASQFLPPVVITTVQIGNARSLSDPLQATLSMSQAERVVRFEFAALDYAAPARNQFSYRLRGFDDTWGPASNRHDATYTNLDPGSYVFEVKASNHDGVWNPAAATLGLSVAPPWWSSAPMKTVYAAVAALLALLVLRSRQRQREEERRHHRELAEREDRLRLALWGSGDEFWDLDMRAGMLYRIGADQLMGGSREERISVDDWRLKSVHPDDLPQLERRLAELIEGRKDFFESEHRIRNADGGWIWVLSRGKIVERDADGRALRGCGTARDVTASRAADRERRIAAEVIKSMTEAVCVTDLEFHFVSYNHAFTRMSGYSEAEIIGQSAALLNCAQHPPEQYQAMRDELVRVGHWRGELWQKRKDGEEFLSALELSEVRDAAGERTHFVGVINDITDRKRAEQELRYLANYDTLTGLPNRTLLGERLGHAIIRARRIGRKVAVLFLDLDRFKHVNDSMGHAAGDRMLKAAGARLRNSVREFDTVARLGGDEFTVVLEEVRETREAEDIALKLIEKFTQPLELDTGQEVVISPSIGISLYPDHGQVPTDLLKFADTAMYQAKERGRNTYMVYAEAMDATARSRANMVSALRKALERDEFSLVFQPKLSLIDESISGVEALLRWNSAELGSVPPTTFIPLAEETGLIVPIGDYVLNAACAQLKRWHIAGMKELTMAVNLAVPQLLRGELATRLRSALADHDLAGAALELEITESTVMANAEQSVRTLTELKGIGVTLAIDDFGTGYSSLSYLKRLPIDTLKIDKAFVGDITTDPDDEAITATVITMAHSLGMNVIAEGVETAEQLEYLREQGCDEIQGYWLSPPLPAELCFEFMRNFAADRVRRAIA